MNMESPIYTAAAMARLIDKDPIVTRQIREHLSDERLIEVLELPAILVSQDEEPVDISVRDICDDELEAEVLRRWTVSQRLNLFG